MRVALVHDDLVQWGGAERVLEALCGIYPDAPIFTSVFDRSNKELFKRFSGKTVYTSFLQRIPGWKSLYKLFLPFYPIAFEQFDFSGYDLVISHTTRFAKCIITKPETKHICYCHTPPRFLWNFSGQNYPWFAELLFSKLRILDKVCTSRVDHFIAGSKNAADRIKRIYGLESKVVVPFVDLDRFTGIESFDGGYMVVVGRPNKYKRFDLAKRACEELGVELKVISGGLSDRQVVQILAGCRALIVPGEEDFGLTPLEAQALGKPVIAYAKGGALETVLDGKTGIFFQEQTVNSLKSAIKELDLRKINSVNCIANAKKFSKDIFVINFKKTVNDLLY